MNARLLAIDDDSNLLRVVELALSQKGYEVFTAEDGARGLRKAFDLQPDLVLLDVMMPGMDGWKALIHLRAVSDRMPVIMLTAKDEQADVVRGLDLGSDDYVTKPFELDELMARVRAALRRARLSIASPRTAAYGDGYLSIDLVKRRIMVEGEPVDLTPTEFRLLNCLVRHAGRLVPHQMLLREVWGPEYIDETQYLKLYIRYLRKKVERDPSDPHYILTEWGEGYYFREFE